MPLTSKERFPRLFRRGWDRCGLGRGDSCSRSQMVSYEVSMGLAIIGALMFARTLSLSGIVAAQQSDSIWFFVYQPIGFVIFLISGIAENNRAPFDLAEAESELVAGFHTEYSGFRWSLFFMAEYTAMVVVTAVA